MAKLQLFALALSVLLAASGAPAEPQDEKKLEVYNKIFAPDAAILARDETLALLKELQQVLANGRQSKGEQSPVEETVDILVEIGEVNDENCTRDHFKKLKSLLSIQYKEFPNAISFLEQTNKAQWKLCKELNPDFSPELSPSELEAELRHRLFSQEAQLQKARETLDMLRQLEEIYSFKREEEMDVETRRTKGHVMELAKFGFVDEENCSPSYFSRLSQIRNTSWEWPNVRVYLFDMYKKQLMFCVERNPNFWSTGA